MNTDFKMGISNTQDLQGEPIFSIKWMILAASTLILLTFPSGKRVDSAAIFAHSW